MKRIIALVLCIILMLSTTGCSNITTNMDSKSNRQKEIAILIKDYDYSDIKAFYNILQRYKERFEREKGVKVNFDIITASNPDDYEKKMNSKLYLSNGPTLIFISMFDTYRNYIEQGVAIDIERKIPNIEKIYDSLLDDEHYFVPIGMIHYPIVLNRHAIDKLEIDDPKLDWTKDDYLKIKEKWLKIEPEHFTKYEYWELFNIIIDELKIIDETNKEVNLNNSRVIQCIKDIRKEIFSGKYIINEDYNYENYYNMIFEEDSEEYKKSEHLQRYYANEKLRNDYFGINGLKSSEIDDFIKSSNDIILPGIIYGEDEQLYTWGFLVNRKGKNVKLGMEFINGLLSDEIQLEMFKTKYDSYPVNMKIEKEIERIEKEKNISEKAVSLRKYILEQIKTGKYKRSFSSKIKRGIKSMLYKDFAKFIFADEPYSDEKLSRELQRLEDKLNMWLNE